MARCESHIVMPLLDTGSESTAQQQQQQFEAEENGKVGDAGRDMVEFDPEGQGMVVDSGKEMVECGGEGIAPRFGSETKLRAVSVVLRGSACC